MIETPAEKTAKTETFTHKLWRWFIAPSSQIEGQDNRRQASLLSSFLLTVMIVATIVEVLTIAFINWENYTGYRQTFAGVFLLGIIYFISRTKHVQFSARLAVILASVGVFVSGWVEPKGVLGGLFDFLILSLWLGSLYLSLTEIFILIIFQLLGLLLFPLTTDAITLNDILIGPFGFTFATSILLLVITRHRNLLEQDRRAELAEKEQSSRYEAARTNVLLRVAERLNVQLDLDTLLKTISEEIALALNTPAATVLLFDQEKDVLFTVASMGIAPDLTGRIAPLSRTTYNKIVAQFGKVFALPDIEIFPSLPIIKEFRRLNFNSFAFAAMEYENELIGSLNAVTIDKKRDFTQDELLLLQGIAYQAALAIVNTRLYKHARRRLENLQALRAIDIAIAANHDLQEMLIVLLDQITKQLRVDAAVILLLDETNGYLEFGTSRGFETSTLRYTRLRIGEGMAGRAAQQRQVVHIHDLRINPQTLIMASSLKEENFVSYYAVPLISQEKVKGVLEIFHRTLLDSDKEWFDFLEALAGQAAIAIESTTLFDDLQRTNDELSQAYDSTIEGWSHALDLRDKETEGHTRRVTELTLELARVFGFSDAELIHIRRGALLHDIGKMGIPDKILLKEGPLDPDEWDIMRQHPAFAHEMLVPIHYLRLALDIPYCHHEKWDGTGYPRGLKGEAIPLIARIFAVVDVWDALTSDRPYREAWAPGRVMTHIQQGAGGHFDPNVVEVFLDFMKQKF